MQSGFARMAQKYQNVVFGEIDLDSKMKATASIQKDQLPVVQIDEIIAAEPKDVEAKLAKYINYTTKLDIKSASVHSDLQSYIIKSQLECLNYSKENPLESIITENDSYLESDVDEQLLISIAFNQPVKLYGIKIIPAKDKVGNAPKSIKLYSNARNLGFSDAESIDATDSIELDSSYYNDPDIIKLRYVRFQNTNTLSIFIENNIDDDDVTIVNQIVFIGTPVESNDFSVVTKKTE
ncbi:hypothetical protein BB560_002836 [Smittium megazygosporum]|uniref:PITH domain-containing protein n=1 Tax=Smittium megazygosporum TaxID=133381 RepID=A0A2T9ZDM8_9FUNG|nr:hypothetical protein BB560_002836 [Smittium megazygosporum]